MKGYNYYWEYIFSDIRLSENEYQVTLEVVVNKENKKLYDIVHTE